MTSRNSFRSSVAYISSTIFSVITRIALSISPPPKSSMQLTAIGISEFRYCAKIAIAESWSGRSIRIFISNLPGLKIAGSMRSSLFEAPITITLFSSSTPSSSASSCGTIVDSMSELMPLPLMRYRDSISSKKITTGYPSFDFSLASSKMTLICRSVSPTYLLSNSGPLMLKK